MGAIARDLEIHFITDAMMVEAYALRDGLSLAQFLGCQIFLFSHIMPE
jgi:hypothetical protein